MCIFSSPVELVADTRIFAARRGPRQALAYQMRTVTPTATAMILPLPSIDADVTFVDLSPCPDFFARLDQLFPTDYSDGVPQGGTLDVVRVGAFEASVVPDRASFARLDPRFRLDDALWPRLPAVDGWSFAVFQLAAGASTVHPMALTFQSRLADNVVFFPTVHVHHGDVPATAAFDHILYLQGRTDDADWLRSTWRAEVGLHDVAATTAPLLTSGAWVRRRQLRGLLPNTDTLVTLASA